MQPVDKLDDRSSAVIGETYRRWASLCCPCCGAELEAADPDRQAIGEGVVICGRCVLNDHLEPPALVAAMLEAILTRSEEPIERLPPGAFLPCSGGLTNADPPAPSAGDPTAPAARVTSRGASAPEEPTPHAATLAGGRSAHPPGRPASATLGPEPS